MFSLSDATRLGVWVLDGDPGHMNLLKFALSEETYPHTLVMLVVSMTNPCSLLDQLQMWSNKIHDHLRSLNINPDLERDCRHRCKYKVPRTLSVSCYGRIFLS